MKTIHLNLTLKHSFGNLERGQHVLIVCTDKQGGLLLGHKPDFYPKGIYRLIGGGVDPGETITQAAIREIQEEIGIEVKSKQLKQIYKVVVDAQAGNTKHHFVTHILYLMTQIDPDALSYNDDIANLEPFSLPKLKQLIEKYHSFKPNHVFQEPNGYKHYWQDYGMVYGPIHHLVYDYLISNNSD